MSGVDLTYAGPMQNPVRKAILLTNASGVAVFGDPRFGLIWALVYNEIMLDILYLHFATFGLPSGKL